MCGEKRPTCYTLVLHLHVAAVGPPRTALQPARLHRHVARLHAHTAVEDGAVGGHVDPTPRRRHPTARLAVVGAVGVPAGDVQDVDGAEGLAAEIHLIGVRL